MSQPPSYIHPPISGLQSDLQKKRMPPIVNYESEVDSDDNDEEDTKPLSQIRLERSLVQAKNPPCSDSSSSSTPSDNEEEFEISDKSYRTMPLPGFIRSKVFQMLKSNLPPSLLTSENFSFTSYLLFFHEQLTTGDVFNKGHTFRQISSIVLQKWSQLSDSEQLAYTQRSSGLKNSFNQENLTLLNAKKILQLNQNTKRCLNLNCPRDAVTDQRWNISCCSPKCVLEHCRQCFLNMIHSSDSIKSNVFSHTTDVTANPGRSFSDALTIYKKPEVLIKNCSVTLRPSDVKILETHLPNPAECLDSTTELFQNNPKIIFNAEKKLSNFTSTNHKPPGLLGDNLFERFKRQSSTFMKQTQNFIKE